MDVDTRISSGPVRGFVSDSVLVFRGIPYAAPPLGDLRFRAPQTAAPWRETLIANTFAPAPPQLQGRLLGSRPIEATSEDCLYLNVYTPALAGSRPVLVWIFGGGFIAGSGSDPLTSGERLASRGDVVVVTFSYRLGALGFLQLGEYGDADANVGLLDQIAVLRWVQHEITQFGGDPGCVTIFGESAGAMSVCDLLAMPSANGLFHRAIAQSGAAASVQSLQQAQRTTAEFFNAMSLPPVPESLAALRVTPVAQLLDAQARVLEHARRTRSGMSFRPAVDGTYLPNVPLQAAAHGTGADIPLLIGYNLDEQRLYASPREPVSDDLLLQRVQARLAMYGVQQRDAALQLIDAYRRCRTSDPRTSGEYSNNLAIWCAIDGDASFRVPALRLLDARAHQSSTPDYLYLLSWKSPALRGWLGACHAIDVPFVFGNLDSPGMRRFAGAGAEAEALSQFMMDCWCGFARDGKPPSEDWRPYDSTSRSTMIFDRISHVAEAPYDIEHRAWQDVLGE